MHKRSLVHESLLLDDGEVERQPGDEKLTFWETTIMYKIHLSCFCGCLKEGRQDDPISLQEAYHAVKDLPIEMDSLMGTTKAYRHRSLVVYLCCYHCTKHRKS